MGVKGLTSYVRQVQRAVSDQITCPVPSNPNHLGPLIIDGWAWIFHAYLTHFPDSIRGGNYKGFAAYLSSIIAALRAALLDPIFIFDGPYLPLKMPTVLARQNAVATSNSAFMRSTSRTNPRFQTQMTLIPPLLYDCTLQTLRDEQVGFTIAESEADSAVAELAERMGGWAVSNDSDFFILCAKGTGCKGYVPIDTLEYIVKLPEQQQAEVQAAPSSQPEEDDGFHQVAKGKKGKGRGAAAAQQALPAEMVLTNPPTTKEEGTLLSVRFTAYSSLKLAQVLGLSPSMLPLFAALVGNDYTTSVQNNLLGQALPTGPERLSRVAAILKDECQRVVSGSKTPSVSGSRSGAATPSRKGLVQIPSLSDSVISAATSATATPTRGGVGPDLAILASDPVRAMVNTVVTRILDRPENATSHVSSGEKADVVDSIIDSVCTYSLLTSPQLAAHTSARFFSNTNSIIRKYQDLYAAGHFDKTLVEALTQRIYICKQFAEDPDLRSVQTTHARQLRRWVWGVLFQSWGMDWARESMEEPEPDEEENVHDIKLNKIDWEVEGDPNELIPVETPPSSVDGTSDNDDESVDLEDLPSRPGSALDNFKEPDGPKPPPAVKEYARKGDRLVGELCQIHSIETLRCELEIDSDLCSEHLASQPVEARLSGYLLAHDVITSDLSGIDKQHWPLIATLRYLITSEYQRLGEFYRKSNWSRLEIISAIHPPLFETTPIAPTTRTIHLMSMLQLTLQTSWQLAQSLLLVPEVFHIPPSALVNGETFHHLALTTLNVNQLKPPPMLDAVLAGGMEERLSIDVEALRKLKREKKAVRKEEEKVQNRLKTEKVKAGKKNAFAFLDEEE